MPIGSGHGAAEGLRDRDRVRHRRARGREQPGLGVLAADQRLRRRDHQPQGRPGGMGLRRRAAGQRRPRLLARRLARPRGRDHARQRRAHQRRPVLRRPRPPGDLDPRSGHRPRGGALGPGGRGDHPAQHGPRRRQAGHRPHRRRRGRRLQEQLRRQGQQLRLPRELPARPGDAVRPHRRPGDAPLRHPPGVLRVGQGGMRAARRPHRSGAVPAQPAGRLLRGGGRAGDDAEAADREHARRAPLRRPEVPPPPRHRRRRQHERDRHLPQDRDDGDRAGDDRGRRPRRGLAARQPGRRDQAGEPRPDA